MKAIIISLFILTFVFFLHGQSQLKLYINFTKDTYLTGEYIQYEVGVENISNYLYTKGWEKLELNLTDEYGNEVPYKGIAHPTFLPWERQEIDPGEKVYNILLINDFWGKRWQSLATTDLYLDPGKYTLEGTLYLPDGGTIKSEASFQIIEPIGEELSVYNSFVKIITNYKPYKPLKNSNETVINLQLLIDDHRNTVYAPLILVILDAMYDFATEEYDKAFLTRKKLVEDYSWSVRGMGAFEYILETIKSDSERLEYLKKIHEKSKGTMMEKVYDQKIKKSKE